MHHPAARRCRGGCSATGRRIRGGKIASTAAERGEVGATKKSQSHANTAASTAPSHTRRHTPRGRPASARRSVSGPSRGSAGPGLAATAGGEPGGDGAGSPPSGAGGVGAAPSSARSGGGGGGGDDGSGGGDDGGGGGGDDGGGGGDDGGGGGGGSSASASAPPGTPKDMRDCRLERLCLRLPPPSETRPLATAAATAAGLEAAPRSGYFLFSQFSAPPSRQHRSDAELCHGGGGGNPAGGGGGGIGSRRISKRVVSSSSSGSGGGGGGTGASTRLSRCWRHARLMRVDAASASRRKRFSPEAQISQPVRGETGLGRRSIPAPGRACSGERRRALWQL